MTGHITKHIVANEIRMMRTQHHGALLIVEGPSDKTAYKNLLDKAACRIVIAHGKGNAVGAIAILESALFPGVLAIIDSDFRRLECAALPSANVLSTDDHDLECMMCRSPAFHKLVAEYANSDRLDDFQRRAGGDVAQLLAHRTMRLGYLRWASIRNGWNLSFEKISFSSFVDRDSLVIDDVKLFVEVRNRSQKHELSNSDMLLAVGALTSDSHNPWHVSCGHDILELLSFALRSAFAAHRTIEVGREQLERGLRLAYERAFFSVTKLYSEMRAWEERNQGYFVLPHG